MSVNSVSIELRPIEDNGPLTFRKGEKFNSFKSVEQRLEKHSQQSFIYFWRRDSKKISKSHWAKKEGINPELEYYLLKYSCIFGGAKCNRKGKSRKNLESKRDTNCQAYFCLRLSKDHQFLEVISSNNVHNHEISEEFSKSLSNCRKLTAAEKLEVLEMLHLKIDRRLIIEYVRMKMSKDLKLKHLFNLQASDKTDWAKVSSRSKEVLETWVRNYIVGHDEEVGQLPKFKTLKSLKRRSKGYQKTTDGALVEVVLPDTASSRSSFSPRSENFPRSGFSPLGPMASAVFIDNIPDHSQIHSEHPKYLTIGGNFFFEQASVENIDNDCVTQPLNRLSRANSFDSVDTEFFLPAKCKEETTAPIVSDSEENPEPLLQTSTQCLPDYIVQQCENGDEDDQSREINSEMFMESFEDSLGPLCSPSSCKPEIKLNCFEEHQPTIPRKRRPKASNYGCRLCPRKYGRLLQLQMTVFKAKKRKLLEEIALLRLKRRKLTAEVEQIKKARD